MSYRIYSIESRKGGVGKTTVALNLAKLLVEKDPVLLIDCDFGGTSLVGPVKNSPIWKNDTNVLTYVDRGRNNKELYILQYYRDFFIKGVGNAEALLNQAGLSNNKINIIGSSLPGPLHDSAINLGLLMDELHSYWMVEFIQQIIQAFEKKYVGKEVHIIIDNSPGYTFFTQALHDYMFEEGPKVAKFLLVSSLDSQDLQVNIEAAAEIRKSVQDRIMVAKYYTNIKNTQNQKELDIESKAVIESNDNIKEFFFDFIENDRLKNAYSGDYADNFYISLLINKVPQFLEGNKIDIDYDKIAKDNIKLLQNIVRTTNSGEPQNLVYYDEAIVYQYFIWYLQGHVNAKQEVNYWNRRFKALRQQLQSISFLSPKDAIEKLNTYYEGLQLSLFRRGYVQLSKQLDQKWTTKFISTFLIDLINYTKESVDFEVKKDSLIEAKVLLKRWNRKQLDLISSITNERQNEALFVKEAIEYLEIVSEGYNDKASVDYLVTLSLLLKVFISHYLHLSEPDKTIKRFAIREFENKSSATTWYNSINEELIFDDKLKFGIEDAKKISVEWFNRSYRILCFFIARLIDQINDFYAVLYAIQLYVPRDIPMSFSKEMKEYLLDVIMRKKTECSEHKLAEIKARSNVMINIQDILRDIVFKLWKE